MGEDLAGNLKGPALLFSGFVVGVICSHNGNSILGGAASTALTALTWKYATGDYITGTNKGSLGLIAVAVTGTVLSAGYKP